MIRELMDKFVCVRLVKANAMDLTLYQFDYDLTFAVILMNADGTVYGRYGTRSEREDAEKDISLSGFAATLEAALTLHARYPVNRGFLEGKQPRPTSYKTPDDFPSLRGKYKSQLDYQGQVAQSCMHCHQILDAHRDLYRAAGKPIPDKLLFPYPLPDVFGLRLDAGTRATVEAVASNSPAAGAGMQPDDVLLVLDGQAILSIADVQWVLDNADDPDRLEALIRRGGETRTLTIALPRGWRRATDISWRVSTWPLRRMGAGGLRFEPLSAGDRRRLTIEAGNMALLVNSVGQYGPHGAGKRAGFRKGDVVVAFDNRTDLTTDTALLAYAAQNTRPGQRVTVSLLRNGKPMNLTLPMQQ